MSFKPINLANLETIRICFFIYLYFVIPVDHSRPRPVQPIPLKNLSVVTFEHLVHGDHVPRGRRVRPGEGSAGLVDRRP